MSLRKLFPDGVYPSEYGGPEDRSYEPMVKCDFCGCEVYEHLTVVAPGSGMRVCEKECLAEVLRGEE